MTHWRQILLSALLSMEEPPGGAGSGSPNVQSSVVAIFVTEVVHVLHL